MQLFINNLQAVLLPDTSISIEVHSPLFDANANGAFSYEFKLDAERNRHIVGNADLTDGESVYKVLHLKPFRLIAEGVPMLSGVVRISQTVNIENGLIPISLASDNKEFDELIEDMNCQDVPVGNVLLGTAIKGIKVIGHAWSMDYVLSSENSVWGDEFGTKEFDLNIPQKETLKPTTANVSMPYSAANPFCNMRRCWQKMQKSGNEENTTWNKTREYDVLEASEQGSAPSFYVLYWLSQLFKSLNIPITQNQLESIEDFKRLAFANNNPCFEVRDEIVSNAKFANAHPDIQNSEDRGTAPYVQPDNYNFTKEVPSTENSNGHSYNRIIWYYRFRTYYAPHEVKMGNNGAIGYWAQSVLQGNRTVVRSYFQDFDVSISQLLFSSGSRWHEPLGVKALMNVYFAVTTGNAYATSENFPDKDVKSTLQALQDAFGIRFLFDSGNQTVRIVLLREVLRDTTVSELPGITHEMYKSEENIRGLRITYGTSTDEEKDEAKAKDKTQYYNNNDSSTTYNYHDFSNIAVEDYEDIVHQVSAYEKRCFYNPKTGNTYRVKLDSDATDEATAYPSLFEVAQCNAAEFGDCSDPDLTEEISIGFTPLFPNNVTKVSEEEIEEGGSTVYAQRFATFIDGDIHGEEVATIKDNSFSIASTPQGASQKSRSTIKVEYSFTSPHNFDRAGSEDSPLFKPTQGLVLGLMRGPGGDGGVTIVQQDYDGNGNDEWAISPGNYAFHADIMDDYGQLFDYNGSEQGVGPTGDDRFSLRLRAEKPNPAYDANSSAQTVILPDGTEVPNKPYLPIDSAAAKRGLADKFYSEYAHLLLNGHTTVFKRTMELAVLRNIDILKRQHIDDKVGLIKKYNFSISDKGLSPVTIELLHL